MYVNIKLSAFILLCIGAHGDQLTAEDCGHLGCTGCDESSSVRKACSTYCQDSCGKGGSSGERKSSRKSGESGRSGENLSHDDMGSHEQHSRIAFLLLAQEKAKEETPKPKSTKPKTKSTRPKQKTKSQSGSGKSGGTFNGVCNQKIGTQEANRRWTTCCQTFDPKQCSLLCKFDNTGDEARTIVLVTKQCPISVLSTAVANKMMQCSTDGQDNFNCCQKHGVPEPCIQACRGPSASTIKRAKVLKCLDYGETISKCNQCGMK